MTPDLMPSGGSFSIVDIRKRRDLGIVTRRNILAHLAAHGPATEREISSALGLKKVYPHLIRLVRGGHILVAQAAVQGRRAQGAVYAVVS